MSIKTYTEVALNKVYLNELISQESAYSDRSPFFFFFLESEKGHFMKFLQQRLQNIHLCRISHKQNMHEET